MRNNFQNVRENNQKSNVIESKRLIATRNSHIDKQFNNISVTVQPSFFKILNLKNSKRIDPQNIIIDFDMKNDFYYSNDAIVSIYTPFRDRIIKGDLWNKNYIKKLLECLEDYIDFIGWDKIDGSFLCLKFSPPKISIIESILNSNREPKDKWCGIVSASTNFTSDDYVSQKYSNPFKLDDKDRLVLKYFNNRETLDNLVNKNASLKNLSLRSCESYLLPTFPFSAKKDYRTNFLTSSISIEVNETTMKFIKRTAIIAQSLHETKIEEINFAEELDRNDLCIPVEKDQYAQKILFFVMLYSLFSDKFFMSEIEKDLTAKQLVDLIYSVRFFVEDIVNIESTLENNSSVSNDNSHYKKLINNSKNFVLLQRERVLQGIELDDNDFAFASGLFPVFNKYYEDMLTNNEIKKLKSLKSYNNELFEVVENSDVLMEAFLRKEEWFNCFVNDYETIAEALNDVIKEYESIFVYGAFFNKPNPLFNRKIESNEKFRNAFGKYRETMSVLDFIIDIGNAFDHEEETENELIF